MSAMLGIGGTWVGDVAQLGERRTCTAEAVGSNPIISIRTSSEMTNEN